MENGNVGIGTTNPAEMLHINKPSGSLGLRVSSDIGSYQYMNFGATNGYSIGRDSDDKFFINRDEPIGTGVLRILTVQSDGKVGIGTANPDPSARLHVSGGDVMIDNNHALEMVQGNGWNSAIRTSENDLHIYNFATGHIGLYTGVKTGYATCRLLINNNGNVGVGPIIPAYDFDVNGDIRATGSVFYGGTEGNTDGTAYSKPDYVFEEGYDVISIDQVETYLKKENHLPWMTSVKQEKEENGNVIDMTRMAFETVETAENIQIQIIGLNKLIKEQAELIKTQQKRISALEKTFAQNEMLKQRLEALEKRMDERQFTVSKEVQ